jgi:hypothetical protein
MLRARIVRTLVAVMSLGASASAQTPPPPRPGAAERTAGHAGEYSSRRIRALSREQRSGLLPSRRSGRS